MLNKSKWIKLAGLALVVMVGFAAMGNFTVARAADDPAQGRVRPVLALLRDLTEATTKLTKLTVQDIRKGIADGKSLSELITAAGGSSDQVKHAAKESALKQIEEALTNGKIKKEQAEKLRSNLDKALDQMMNHKGKRPLMRPRHTATPTAPATQDAVDN